LSPDQVDNRPDSIGKAIPNVSVHVINEEGNECAPGETGELIHRGALIAKGYWGDPEKTAQVYRPNPLLPPHLRFTERVVYSGDLMRKDEEGYLYFVGRRDNMLKCSGHRISPEEITETLLRMKGVLNAAVIGIDDEHLGHKIAAFLQVDESAPVSAQDGIQFAKKFLPPHMIPSVVKCMRQFPKNANGKVDLIELKKLVRDDDEPL
jgi:acyl-coenzyme A synthetase/AMP-(fatty) acid ligase